MKIKVMDDDGTIRLARAEDVPHILQMRDLVEFACEAEELYDALDPPSTSMRRKSRYDWHEEEEKDVSALCRHSSHGPTGSTHSDPDEWSAETEPDGTAPRVVRSIRR